MYLLLLCLFYFEADEIQYNGQEGVELAIRILRQELRITMALAGYVIVSSRNS